ncbi:MAG: CysS/YqeB C-terminal domain-containing protein, partial [Solirubrobacteraceae bacterium]
IRNSARGLVEGPGPPWSAPLRERFFDALAHDFNTPRALAIVAEWEREANRSPGGTVGGEDLHAMLDVLGLASLMRIESRPVSAEAATLLAQRERARRERAWVEADAIRDRLRALGWEVRDGPDGPELVPAA